MTKTVETNLRLGVTVGTYMLDIWTSNIKRDEPEYCVSLRMARKRRQELLQAGYGVALFRVTATGLDWVR